MDELFEDLDRTLDGSSSSEATSEVLQSDYVSLKTIEVSSLSMPLALSALTGLQGNSGEIVGKLQQRSPNESQLNDSSGLDEVNRQSKGFWSSGQLMDKLLLIAACASLFFSLFLWLFSQGKLPQFATAPQAQSTLEGSAVDADTQFADYVQRSLEAIDRKTAATPPALGTLPSGPNLPTVSVRGNNPGDPPASQLPAGSSVSQPNASLGVLSRVYVPIYQQPTTPNSVAVPPTASPAPAATQQAAAPVAVHTLVGLLDLGNQSAALFEVQGNTKRIQVGQPIGNSGWILVAVANQEAVIRRNGEVRSIYVGQQI